MVRAARQLLSAITKVLILADRVVIKQLITAKEKVLDHILPGICFVVGYVSKLYRKWSVRHTERVIFYEFFIIIKLLISL